MSANAMAHLHDPVVNVDNLPSAVCGACSRHRRAANGGALRFTGVMVAECAYLQRVVHAPFAVTVKKTTPSPASWGTLGRQIDRAPRWPEVSSMALHGGEDEGTAFGGPFLLF